MSRSKRPPKKRKPRCDCWLCLKVLNDKRPVLRLKAKKVQVEDRELKKAS